jgi:5-methylcytosine-specific restriction endonuclease McrA
VEDFLRRVQPDGTVKDRSETSVTMQITVTAEEEALIHRLTEVLSARGHVPTTAEAIMVAVNKLLDQRDQVRRAAKMAEKDAARAAEREAAEMATALRQLEEGEIYGPFPADLETEFTVFETPVTLDRQGGEEGEDLLPRGSQGSDVEGEVRRRIPEAVKRAVFGRAEGRCQHVMPDGSRCGATRMVEIDHVVPVARGGGDQESNLTLVCREHNQYRARLIMGHSVMDRYRLRR